MMRVTHSQYTGTDGRLLHCVVMNGQAVTAPSEDEKFHAEYARSLFGNAAGPAELSHWDGNAAVETVVDRNYTVSAAAGAVRAMCC